MPATMFWNWARVSPARASGGPSTPWEAMSNKTVTAGAPLYNQRDSDKARRLMKEAGYAGQPMRWLSTREYEFMYKSALVAKQQLEAIGFVIDLQVLDWATQLQRRPQGEVWDIFFTHGPILPEPSLYGFFNPQSAGWWTGPERDRVLNAFNAESNPQRRVALWADVQRLLYEEVPVIKLGNFNALAARSSGLNGLTPAPWPFFWNTWLQA